MKNANLQPAFHLAFKGFPWNLKAYLRWQKQIQFQRNRILFQSLYLSIKIVHLWCFFLSKTDPFRKVMTLIIAALAYNLCALCLLQNYFKQFFITFDNFLYNNTSGSFNQDHVIKSIQERTWTLGYKRNNKSYSFEKNKRLR